MLGLGQGGGRCPGHSAVSCQVVQKLTQMVGKNVKLYDMVLQFLRTLFLRTRNVHYCTLRAELLMSLHDLDVGDICTVDPCHKVQSSAVTSSGVLLCCFLGMRSSQNSQAPASAKLVSGALCPGHTPQGRMVSSRCLSQRPGVLVPRCPPALLCSCLCRPSSHPVPLSRFLCLASPPWPPNPWGLSWAGTRVLQEWGFMLCCVSEHRHGSTETTSWGPWVSCSEPLTGQSTAVLDPHREARGEDTGLLLALCWAGCFCPRKNAPAPCKSLSTARALWLPSLHIVTTSLGIFLPSPVAPRSWGGALGLGLFDSASGSQLLRRG